MRVLFVIISIALLVVSVRFYTFFSTLPNYASGDQVSFESMLLQESQPVFGNRQRIVATLPNSKPVYITTSRYPIYSYGDTLAISGVIKETELSSNSYIFTMQFPEIVLVEKPSFVTNPLFVISSYIRTNTATLFESTLSPNQASLMLGMVLGVKTSLSSDFKKNLQETGVMHVVAASGMNITLVAGFLSYTFGMFLKRYVALTLIILGIILYAFLAGLEASIVRAALMGMVAFSSQLFGRQYLSYYGLCLTGLCMVLYSPLFLFDIGFQLSFMATLGIISLKPLLDNLFNTHKSIQKIIGDDFTTTTSAQISTTPIILSQFQSYSLVSLLINILVLWTVPAIMIVGGLASILGLLFEPLGKGITYFAIPFLWYFEFVISFFAQFNTTVAVTTFPWPFTVSYYLFVCGFVMYMYQKREQGKHSK